MASNSSSSVKRRFFKYDVFISFSGEDTQGFVGHLYHALVYKSIYTYKGYETIEKRRKISDDVIRSIKDSGIHIIVFSRNYASSSWCLDELVKIMECQKTKEQTAYPIFYDVEPTEIRKQTGVVGEAFAKHEKEEAAGRWRVALKEAADLAGWVFKSAYDGHKMMVIQKIVENISEELASITYSFRNKLIGMKTRVNKVVASLEIDHDDVCIIGIKGMGGSGKTALARAVFDCISIRFEGQSFVENVREVSRGSGLEELQKRVLADVLNDDSVYVTSVSEGKKMMKKMMPSRKVLVVLDDVDDICQLEALAGEPSWFKAGSRIIVTTRNEHLWVAHRVNFIHDVNLLSHEEAICLLSWYAFGRYFPIQGYEELSRNIVHYAGRLPLTLKVLGSFLFGRSEREWKETFKRLKTIPLKETLETLEVSYNDLEDEYKEIFLDVACILKGERKDEVIRILKSCGFNAEIGLKVLEERSLITISDTGHLSMHGLIEEMGWNVVRREDPDEPTRNSRLWIKEEIEDILHKDSGTEATKSIKLLTTQLSPDIIMKGLTRMTKLRLLYVDNRYQTDVYASSSSYYTSANLPNALRCVFWRGYPLSCLPKKFQAEKLVYLNMRESNISQVWEGGERKVFNELRFLDLKFSKLRTFDLGMTPRLERLDLRGCNDFVEFHMPVECPKLKYLDLCGSMLRKLDLRLTPYLEELHLEGCNDLLELHMPVECPKLKYLDLCGSMLRKLDLRLTPYLEELHLEGCNDLLELHMPVRSLKLKVLVLAGSKVSNLNLGLAPHLEKLDLRRCYDFVKLYIAFQFSNLKYLNLSGSKLCKLDLGQTPYIEELHLEECNYLLELLIPVVLPKLKYLNLSGSKLSKLDLGLTPYIEELHLEECNLLELLMPIERPKLKFLNLGSSKLGDFNLGLTPHLEELTLSIEDMKHLPDNICMLKHLKSLEVKSCFLLEQLPKDLDRLECLEKLHLSDCISLTDIPDSICNMKCLKFLQLPYCILVEKLPEELGCLECLEELNIEGTGINHLPRSIFELEGLCIVWSRGLLELHGFTSFTEISPYTASCYIKKKKALTTGVSSKG